MSTRLRGKKHNTLSSPNQIYLNQCQLKQQTLRPLTTQKGMIFPRSQGDSTSQSASLSDGGPIKKEEVTVHQKLEDATSQPAPPSDSKAAPNRVAIPVDLFQTWRQTAHFYSFLDNGVRKHHSSLCTNHTAEVPATSASKGQASNISNPPANCTTDNPNPFP